MSEPIRILCVFSSLDRGGAESMCMNLYRHIDRSKVQFDFVKHAHSVGAFEEEIYSLGGRIFEAPRYKIYNHIDYCQWWRHHLKQHPEHKIVHGHFFGISSVFFSVAKKMDRITVGHSHCTPSVEGGIKTRFKRHLISKIESCSDYCFACSTPAGQWVFPHKPFTVLNNAIDTQQFTYSSEVRERVRSAFGLGDALVLGTVGRIVYQKNPMGVIEIFRAVKQRRSDAKLLWVGELFMRTEVETKLREYDLEDSVIFTGVRSDVNELYQAMDVFIFPSNYEGLGIVAVEAQNAGLPTFCSDQVPEEAKLTDLCHFLPLGDYDKWANAILTTDLSHRRDTMQEIIDAGYDIHATSKWLEEFYLEIAQTRAFRCLFLCR